MSSLNSSVSDFDSPSKLPSHPLGSEVNQMGFNSWKREQMNSSHSINDDSNHQSWIIEPKVAKILENEPQLQMDDDYLTTSFNDTPNKQNPKNSEENQQKPNSINNAQNVQNVQNAQNIQNISNLQQNSNPKTMIEIQDQLLSRQSANISSKLSQYNSDIDHQSYTSFLSIRQNSYQTFIKSFELLFQNMHNLFNERIQTIQNSYVNFFKIKYNQVKNKNSLTNIRKLSSRYAKNQIIYADCQNLINQLCKKLKEQYEEEMEFGEIVGECYENVRKCMEEVRGIKEGKQIQIRSLFNKIYKISQEMTDLMIPKHRKAKKKQLNQQLLMNGYVRTKYLISQQKSYLHLMAEYLRKVINYISNVCLELEPKICLICKQVIIAYTQALKPQQFQKVKASFQKLQSLNCFTQIYKQNIKMLEISTPPILLNQTQFSSICHSHTDTGKQLHKIIQHLISQSQSLVYLPCLQIQPQDYIYHSKKHARILWRKVSHEKRINQQQIKAQQANIIITQQGHLIIEISQLQEHKEKIALLKISQIKISRKNDEIVLIDRGKGVIGYLLNSNAVLGYLNFQPLDVMNVGKDRKDRKDRKERNGEKGNKGQVDVLIEQFIGKIRDVIEIRKQKQKQKAKQKEPIVNPISLYKRKNQKKK